MKNTYWLLRHGRSLANEAGIIISKKENGIKPEWTLAEEGRKQAEQAGELLGQALGADGLAGLHVYCSPFSRTMETARLAAGKAGLTDFTAPRFQTTDSLVERDFGQELEGRPYEGERGVKPHEVKRVGGVPPGAYETLWACDAVDLGSRSGQDGESLDDVSNRIRAFFEVLEAQHTGVPILLVSHGDTLSILQATMEGSDVRQHRSLAFGTGELRKLGTGPGNGSGAH